MWFAIALIGLTPLLTWVALLFLSEPKAEPKPSAPPREYAELGAPSELPIPVVTSMVVLIKGNADTPSFVVPTNTQPVRGLEKLTLPLADIKEPHYVVAQIFLVGKNTDALIHRYNKTQPKVYNAVTNVLSSKTLEETRRPGYRNILRSEILQVCNAIMGKDTVQDVIIGEFLTQ